MKKILLSACLAGERCRYDGADQGSPVFAQLVQSGRAIVFCPETAGGLPVPRPPAELSGGRVRTKSGEDVTRAFASGAKQAVRLCKEHGIQTAVLKSKSPSCGKNRVYDGSFTGTLTAGEGLTAKALREAGIRVITEEEFLKEYKG